MFVKDNTGASIKEYFYDRLKGGNEDSIISTYFSWLLWAFHGLEKMEHSNFLHLHLSESELLKWRNAVKRIQSGTPIQYIVGKTEFYGMELSVNHHTLIPRPETEELVDLVVHNLTSNVSENNKVKFNLWDIGTGSGCIALGVAKSHQNINVVGSDFSKDALKVAEANQMLNKICNAKWLKHDILKDVVPFKDLDVIVSNPPYVLNSDKKKMQSEVLDHEPHSALFVPDENPLLFYKKIVEVARKSLNQNGLLYFEVHEDLANEVAILMQNSSFQKVVIHKDLQGKERMVSGELGIQNS